MLFYLVGFFREEYDLFLQVDGEEPKDGVAEGFVFSVRFYIILIEALNDEAIYILEWLEVYFLGDGRINVPVPGNVAAAKLLEDFQVKG